MSGIEEIALLREHLHDDPVRQFEAWFAEARERSGLDYPNAMCLATIGPEGFPEGRIVLLKEVEPEGFVFYTNLRSPKAAALRERPRAALTFYWELLRRQVRVQGVVEGVSAEAADAYFRTRPRGSQIGAWASDQSAILADREPLEARVREIEERFRGIEVPRPPHWGGLRVVPRAVEFWQERVSRLHDRFLYRRRGEEPGWEIVRLSP